jgi:two-component system KDP operon response regulator KdpE
MSSGKILVVDDEPQIRRVMRVILAGENYEIVEARSGEAALLSFREFLPDLVLLDLNMSGMSGLETCRAIRETSEVPIIVLTVRQEEAEKVAALDAGADDYVTKPFSTPELQARARALLRRVPGTTGGGQVAIGDLVLDPAARTVTQAGELVHLTRTEWELLRGLMTNAGRVLTHQQLFRMVWSGRAFGDAQQYLRVYVARLRRKIEPDVVRPRYIHTEPGVGYRFSTSAEVPPR